VKQPCFLFVYHLAAKIDEYHEIILNHVYNYECEHIVVFGLGFRTYWALFLYLPPIKLTIMGFVKEFRDFAVRGNVMDLAIGVIIGGAFNNIIKALVDAVIMPIIGMIIGDVQKFRDLQVGGIKIGVLIQAILDFIIIAFVLFLIVKAMNSVRKKSEPAVTPPSTTEVLLAEIRDELKKK
jgi:large conductance mechanosensitive channel